MGKSIWDTRFNSKKLACDAAIDEEDGQWITIHGAHVFVNGNGDIIAGAGGNLNSEKLKSNNYHIENAVRRSQREIYLEKNPYEERYSNQVIDTVNDLQRRYLWSDVNWQNTQGIENGKPDEDSMNKYYKELDLLVTGQIGLWVEAKNPTNLREKMSSEEAAQEIGGSDNTSGSCASLTVAYVANQYLGKNVHDFQGGYSRIACSMAVRCAFNEVAAGFSYKGWNSETDDFYDAEKEGGGVWVSNDAGSDEYHDKAIEMLEAMEPNKEYVSAFDNHITLTRKLESGEVQYLEMQDSSENCGWKTMWTKKETEYTPPSDPYYKDNEAALRRHRESWEFQNSQDYRRAEIDARFGGYNARRSIDWQYSGVIPAERFAKTDYVKKMIPYINTPKNEQLKENRGRNLDKYRNDRGFVS